MSFKLRFLIRLALCGFPLEAEEMSPSRKTVVVLHTNDVHGHLTSSVGWEGDHVVGRLAGAVARVPKRVP